jgi:hypothetical protein
MMRAIAMILGAAVALAAVAPIGARAASVDADVQRLSAQLDQLSNDPVLGQYAGAQRTLARDSISALQDAGHRERGHALFMAEQRVELARAAAQAEADRHKLDDLQRDHDRIMLEASQADVAEARAELARQRLQYQAAVEQTQVLQQQGAEYSQQMQQAQQEADQAKRLAAAQAHAAELARKEARLAEAATRALRGGGSDTGTSSSGGSLLLAASAFHGNAATLTSSGQRRVADFARAHASQRIRIEPRATGELRVLAGRRAVAVRDALTAAGAGHVEIRAVAHGSHGAEVELRARP